MNPISSDIFGRLSWLTKSFKKLCCRIGLVEDRVQYIEDNCCGTAPAGDLVIEKTLSQVQSLISSNSLAPGAIYKITGVWTNHYDDSTNPGTTIYLHALSENELSVEGWGEFYNIIYKSDSDYYNSDPSALWGIYDGEYNNAYNIGYTYQVGDVIFWGPFAWRNISGSNGTVVDSQTLSGSDWEKITFADGLGVQYTKVLNYIEYDIANDYIIRRRDDDKRIDVKEIANNPISGIEGVAWGLYIWTDIDITSAGYVLNIINFKGINFDNVTMHDGALMINYSNYETSVRNIILNQSVILLELYDGSFLRNINLTNNSEILYCTLYGSSNITNIKMDYYSSIKYVELYDDSFLNTLELINNSAIGTDYAGNPSGLYLSNYSYITTFVLKNNCKIYNCSIEDGSYINNCNLSDNSYFSNLDMYSSSYIELCDLDNGGSITNGYMYLSGIGQSIFNSSQITSFSFSDYSSIANCQLTRSSYISNFQLYDESYFNNLELANTSYINEFYLYSISYFENVNILNNSYINDVSFSQASYVKWLEIINNSYIQEFYFDYGNYAKSISVSNNSHMFGIHFNDGSDSYMNNINLDSSSYFNTFTIYSSVNIENISASKSSWINNISSEFTSIVNVTLNNESYIDDVNTINGYDKIIQDITLNNLSSFSNITLGDGTFIIRISCDEASSFQDIILNDYSAIYACALRNLSTISTFDISNSQFYQIDLSNSSYINNISGGNSDFYNLTLINGSGLSNIPFDGFGISNCFLDGSSFSPQLDGAGSVYNIRMHNSYVNFGNIVSDIYNATMTDINGSWNLSVANKIYFAASKTLYNDNFDGDQLGYYDSGVWQPFNIDY